MTRCRRLLLIVGVVLPIACSPSFGGAYASDPASLAQSQRWSELNETLSEASTPDQAQADGMTALHWAAHWGHAPAVVKLLKAGAKVDAMTEYGITPLAIACRLGHGAVGAELLAAGADGKRLLAGKETLLMHAARSGSLELVASLIESGVDPNATQRQGQTALMWAAERGHSDVVARLLDSGAKRDEKLRSGFTALHLAARQGQSGVVELLIERGADVSQRMNPMNTSGRAPRKGMTALMLAVESAHYQLALQLVDWGADPNDLRSGYAALHAVSWVRRPQRGDNPQGDPPPVGSGEVGSLQFVREMVARGADVNLRATHGKYQKARLTHKGATPFLFASFTNDLPLARLLVELGADIQIRNDSGTTPLLAAAGVGVFVADEFPGSEPETIAMINQLVQWGGQLDDVDQHGETVIHGAAFRSFPRVVQRLCQLGADPHDWYAKNEMGSTPLQVAQGKRPGSFKPNPPTIDAIEKAIRDAGMKIDDWQRTSETKTDWGTK